MVTVKEKTVATAAGTKTKGRGRTPRVAPGTREAEDLVASERAKSRARDFRRIRGHEAFAARLAQLSVRQALPQVLLLTGKAGIGKSMLASYVAALHLCEQRNACGACAACLEIARGAHPEVLVFDDGELTAADAAEAADGEALAAETKPKLTIEDAAEIQEHVSLNPGPNARARVVIIEDIDRVTLGAANRLLKTLEEPPAGARFVLTSSRPRTLLPTIRSRTVRFFVPAPAPMPDLLRELAQSLEPPADGPVSLPPDAELLAGLARESGSPGLWLKRLKQRLAAPPGGTPKAALSPLDAVEFGLAARGVPVPRWLDDFERTLNARYRAVFAEKDAKGASRQTPAVRPADMQKRRALLSTARQHAAIGQIALSAQLLAEASHLETRWTD